MYYVSEQSLKTSIPHKTILSVVVSTLTTPPQQRSLSDHQFVFRFFYDNKILCEIQRVKSLNAKQQCVANLEISRKKPDPSQNAMIIVDRLILQINQDETQKYYVLLNEEKKESIMKSDERILRKRIQILKKYMILSDMKYSQMLHLAYYLDQVQFKYKEEVYKQGDPANFLYLVEKGQFHYAKNVIQDAQIQIKKKKDRPKRYDAKLQNPNRIKNSQSVEMKIGVIEGQSGQSFGQQQIVAEKLRQYNVKCMSTQNLVLKIPAQKYKNVIKSSKTKMQWLKKQNKKKLQIKDEILSRMVSIKNNYKKYADLIYKNQFNRTEQLRINNKDQIILMQPNQNGNTNLPKIRSHSMVSQEHSPKYLNQSLQKSRISEQRSEKQNSKILKKSQKSQENQDDGMFSLTKVVPYRMPKKSDKQRQNASMHSGMAQNASNNSLLPTIASQKYKAVSTHETIDSNIGKNWSASRPIIQLRGLRNKFSGMIDSNSLIKQKEQIFNMKLKMSKQQRQDIFPFQKSEVRQTNRPQATILNKQEIRQMRSAAHSKIFMQKLLVQALKKAGYNSQKDSSQNYIQQDNPNAIVDIKNNIRIPKLKTRAQKHNSSYLVENNAFDECYFRKFQ